MATEEIRTDEEVLENKPVTFTLGKDADGTPLQFEFAEPGRRRARELFIRLEGVYAIYQKAEAAGGFDKYIASNPMDGLRMVNLALDWIYEACPEAGKMRELLDRNADDAEVGEALAAMTGVLNLPLASSPV